MSLDPLVKAIASVSDGWRIAAFSIAAILVAVKLVLSSGRGSSKSGNKSSGKSGDKPAQGKLLFLVAFFICVLGLAPILADAWLKTKPSGPPDVYRLRVIVLDPQHTPVTGATLRTAALNDTATNDKGIAELTIPRATLTAAGKITIYADLDSAGLHASHDIQLAADPNPTATIELKSVRDAVVSGLVEDDQSHAIAGATVSILGGESGLTKHDGTFTLKANAAVGQQVRLHAEKAGYQPVDQDHPAGRGDATIVLTPLPPNKRH
jgi:hypothetical protein